MALIRSSLTTPSSIELLCVDGDANVVWLRGEHDITTVSAVSEVLVQATALDDADLIIDLSEVTFMDGVWVGVIVRTGELLRPRSLVLRSPSRCVRRLFEVCGLSDLFDPERETSYVSEAADALRSWVAIPVADRIELSVPEPPQTLYRVRPSPVVGVVDQASWKGAPGIVDERASNPANSGSP